MSYQKVLIIGNLGGDPEVNYLDNDRVVAKFSVAATERWKKGDQQMTHTEWFRCVAWNKTAKLVEAYLKKGNKVFIECRKREEEYQEKKYTTFLVDVIRTMERPPQQGHSTGTAAQPVATPEPEPAVKPGPVQGTFDSNNDGPDDLPF